MSASRSAFETAWKIVIAGLAHALGVGLGGFLIQSLGLELPREPVEIDPARQWPLLVLGSMFLASGLTAMAVGLRGRLWQRWAILASFAFVANGVSIGLETWIFTTLGGDFATALGALPGSALCALAVSWLFHPPDEVSLDQRLRFFRSQWSAGVLAGRVLLAILAFPVFYLMFGAIVAPIVNPYYAQLEFMVIPPFSTIIGTQLLRSPLFLLVSLPIVIGWKGSRGRLAVALALGHFTAVGLNGLIQTPLFPPAMALAHTFEILGDSVAYAWAIAWLLWPGSSVGSSEPRKLERRTVELARWLRVLAAVLCFIAIGSWPFLYYQVLRWVVCISAGLGATVAHRAGLRGWTLTLVSLTILFNPLFPMPLSQTFWIAADAIAALVFLASFRMPDTRNDAPS